MADLSSKSGTVSIEKTVASPAKAMDRRLARTSKSRAILTAPATVDVAMAGGYFEVGCLERCGERAKKVREGGGYAR